MDSTISLILSRHGETEENKLRIMQGQMPGHLSELGKQQAEQLADLLEEEEIDVIVSSDLARSYDTAMAVARRKGLEPVRTPLLREMDWGIYTGKVANEMDFKNLPESVESVELYIKSRRVSAIPANELSGKTYPGYWARRFQPCHYRPYRKKAARGNPEAAKS